MSNWKEATLKEIMSVSSGESLPESGMRPGHFPVYGGNGINGYHNVFLFDESKLIIGRVGAHCGNVHLTERNNWVTDNALIVSFLNGQQHIKFWYYILSELKIRRYAFEGAQPVITGRTIGKIKLTVTNSLNEQRKIAYILSIADTVIEKTKAAIAKCKAIKQGMLHDLFTRGIDLQTGKLRPKYEDASELYKKSKLGWLPKDWDEDQLSEIVERLSPITYGIVQPGSFDANGVLLIRGQDYISGWAKEPEFFRVTENLHKQFIRSKTTSGDILMCIVGATYGAVSVVPEWINEANITQTTARIRCDKKAFSPLFLEYYLKSEFGRFFINKYVKGSAQPGLNLGDLDKFIIRYPKNIDEQKLIGERIKSIDDKITIEQNYLHKLQQIKEGLMSDLLSGKKEVIIKEEVQNG